MSTWELRLGPAVYRVGPSGCTIGRGTEVDVSIPDPLVSRRHARIRQTPAGLEIEDLGSAQGVRVNGIPIRGKMSLQHGDRIAICAHELGVVDARNRPARERQATREPTARMALGSSRPAPTGATGQASPIEVLLAGAEDALARGEAAECAFALPRVVDVIVRLERSTGVDAALLRRYAVCSLRAARAHARGEWVDAVLDVHAVRSRVMHAATIDALEGALERLPRYPRERLRDHVHALGSPEDRAQYERFCLERLVALADR